MGVKIEGIQGMSLADIKHEIDRGGRFVMYQYTISILVMTFKRPTDIYFIKGSESGVVKGLPYALITLFLGWWGIPWGPIYSIGSLYTNLSGGKDLTDAVVNDLVAQIRAKQPAEA
ncbi:MAG: hypothetical protein U0V74_06665 [Chitinophagales bacterium]